MRVELAGRRDYSPVRAGGPDRCQPRPAVPGNQLYVHRLDSGGTDRSGNLQRLTKHEVIYLQQKTDASSWHRYQSTGRPARTGDCWIIPVRTHAGSAVGSEPPNAVSAARHDPRRHMSLWFVVPAHGRLRPHPYLPRAAAPHLRPARGRHRRRHRRRRQPRHRRTSSASPPSAATTGSWPASSTTASSSPATPTSTRTRPTTSSRSAPTTGSTTASSTSCRRRTRCWRSSGPRSSTRTDASSPRPGWATCGGVGIRVYPRALLEPLNYRPADEDRIRNCDASILYNTCQANQPQPGPMSTTATSTPARSSTGNHPASS